MKLSVEDLVRLAAADERPLNLRLAVLCEALVVFCQVNGVDAVALSGRLVKALAGRPRGVSE